MRKTIFGKNDDPEGNFQDSLTKFLLFENELSGDFYGGKYCVLIL